MKTIFISDDVAVEESGNVLKDGGVVMHPTETCYGLAVDVFNEKAIYKLYKVKEMSKDKPVSILVDSLGMAMEYGIFSEKALELAHEYWPGPLSILVPRKRNLPDFLNPGHEFVSIRYSSDEFSTNMVAALRRPMTTTSANKTTEPQLYKVEEMKGVDLIIDGGEITMNKPSTIVKVDGDSVHLLRQGEILINESL